MLLTIVLVVSGILLNILNDSFFSAYNISTLIRTISFTTIVAFGQTLVLLTGGIDLSCGSVTALTCVLAALLMETVGLDWQSAVVLSLMAGALIGAINGFLIVNTGVPAFIVTFAMMGVAGSIPQIITGFQARTSAPSRFAHRLC